MTKATSRRCPKCKSAIQIDPHVAQVSCGQCGAVFDIKRRAKSHSQSTVDNASVDAAANDEFPLGPLDALSNEGHSTPDPLAGPLADLPEVDYTPAPIEPTTSSNLLSHLEGEEEEDSEEKRARKTQMIMVGGVSILLVALIGFGWSWFGGDAASDGSGKQYTNGWNGKTFVVNSYADGVTTKVTRIDFVLPQQKAKVGAVEADGPQWTAGPAAWPVRTNRLPEAPDPHPTQMFAGSLRRSINESFYNQFRQTTESAPFPPVLADLNGPFILLPGRGHDVNDGGRKSTKPSKFPPPSQLFDTRDGTRVGQYPRRELRGRRSILSPDGNMLVTLDTLAAWRLDAKEPLWSTQQPTQQVSRNAIRPAQSDKGTDAIRGASFCDATDFVVIKSKEILRQRGTNAKIVWRYELQEPLPPPAKVTYMDGTRLHQVRDAVEQYPFALHGDLLAVRRLTDILVLDVTSGQVVGKLPLGEAVFSGLSSLPYCQIGFVNGGQHLALIQSRWLQVYRVSDGARLVAHQYRGPIGPPVTGSNDEEILVTAAFRDEPTMRKQVDTIFSGKPLSKRENIWKELTAKYYGGTSRKWSKPYQILNGGSCRIHWPTGRILESPEKKQPIIRYDRASDTRLYIEQGTVRTSAKRPTIEPTKQVEVTAWAAPETWQPIPEFNGKRVDFALPSPATSRTWASSIAGGNDIMSVVSSQSPVDRSTDVFWLRYEAPGRKKLSYQKIYRTANKKHSASYAVTWIRNGAFASSPNGQLLAINSWNNNGILDLFRHDPEHKNKLQPPPPQPITMADAKPLEWTAFRDNQTLLTLSGGTLRCWDVSNPRQPKPVWATGREYRAPATMSQNGQLVVVAAPGKIDVLDIGQQNCLASLDIDGHSIDRLSLSHDQSLLAFTTINQDTHIHVVNLSSGDRHTLKVESTVATDEKPKTVLGFGFWQEYLAIAAQQTVLVNPQSGELIKTLRYADVSDGRPWVTHGVQNDAFVSNVLDGELADPKSKLNIPVMPVVRIEVRSFDRSLAQPVAMKAARAFRGLGAKFGDGGFVVKGRVSIGSGGRLDLGGAGVHVVSGSPPSVPSLRIRWEVFRPNGVRCAKGVYELPGQFRSPQIIRRGKIQKIRISISSEQRQRIVDGLVARVRTGGQLPREISGGAWFKPQR